VEVRVLGPLGVHHEGASQLVGGSKARELLSLLAIRPNDPISPEVLIDELWEGAPPPTAASALRVHIAHVRDALEPVRPNGVNTRLPLERAGYVLHLSVEELDASKFESLVLRGREAHLQGDVHAAEQALEGALAHWRGPALVEIRSFSAAHGAIARLDQLHLSALEEFGEVRLALGKHADTVDVLLQAVRDFPLAERLTAQLMLALYRCGRQAEALRAYSSLAHRLDDELATKPSAEVRQLEEDMLLQRDRLDFVGATTAVRTGFPTFTKPRLVGRRSELGRLLDLYEGAAAGTRRLGLVSGGAGIGKTALASECANRVSLRGATVLTGSCAPDPDALSPVAEILEAALPLLDPETRAIACEELDLLNSSPSSDERSPASAGVDYRSEQVRLIEGVARTIAALPNCPVLVVEDVQWADDSTLFVLHQLLRHQQVGRLLVIVTYRDEDIDEGRGRSITRLAPRECTDTIHLGGLNEHEVRSLVRAAVGPQVVPALLGVAVTLRNATGGNPFHLRALLEELEAPAMSSIDGTELERIIGNLAPRGVRALVNERVARLSEQSQQVARAAATIAREISPEFLAEICELSVDAVFDAIDEAVSAGLMLEDARDVERFEFAHSLVRNAIYFGTAEEVRHRVHLRVAETMEAHNEAATMAHTQSEIAKHFNAALPDADQGKAAFYAERAGRDATARLAFAESAQWYEYAIRSSVKIGEPATQLGQLHLALAAAYQGMRQPEQARDTCIQAAAYAREANDHPLLADIALAASATWATGFEVEAWTRSLLEEALSALDGTDPARQVRLLGRLATTLYYIDPDREGRLAREAWAISQRVSDKAASAEALLSQHLWLTHEPSSRRERLSVAREAIRLVDNESCLLGLRIRRELLTDLLESAETDHFDIELDRYELVAARLSSPRDIYWAMVLRATQATLRGDLSAGEQLARGAALRGRELEQRATGAEYLQRFVIRFQQGRLAEVLGDPGDAAEARPVYRGGSALPALALAETGRFDAAVRIAKWAVGPDGRGIGLDAFWLGAHAMLASVAVSAGDPDLIELLDELLTPCANHIVTFGAGGAVLGCGHHWLGLLAHARGMPDRAVEHLTAAEAVCERIRAPFWSAQARFDLARVLETRDRVGDRQRADELTTAAVRAAEDGGFERILVRSVLPRPG
jgi:DNA-binding SARP family transcriptional activator